MLKKKAGAIFLLFDTKNWWAYPASAGPIPSGVRPGARFRGIDEDEERIGFASRADGGATDGE